ncbi:hypothetical protein [Microcoleus sp. FACHB-672]|nr:hypothetical protein [Microcoleus sp. FACHB-672]MBD2042933.1 hypothetical protein [Microcoleus sp. FACHB-672]
MGGSSASDEDRPFVSLQILLSALVSSASISQVGGFPNESKKPMSATMS